MVKRRDGFGWSGYVQCEEGSIGLGIRYDSLVPHDSCERGVEVETCVEGFDGIVFGDVAAVTGEEAVVGESVHHGAWTPDCSGQ